MSEQTKLDGGKTPFPDILLDRIMPRLCDTEWRLICVIVRQTFGWTAANGRPKQTDWLSHSQLKRKSGRSGAAISLAIEFLCRNELIEVEDGRGLPLKAACERRRHRGRLYYRLNPLVLSGEHLPVRFKGRFKKVETTTNTQYKKNVVVARNKNATSGNRRLQIGQNDWLEVGKKLRRRPLRRRPSNGS